MEPPFALPVVPFTKDLWLPDRIEKEHRVVSELLLQQLLKLDGIDDGGSGDRKNAVRHIQQWLSYVDALIASDQAK